MKHRDRRLLNWSLLAAFASCSVLQTTATAVDSAKPALLYDPSQNLHGPDYDIPDDQWKREADKRIDQYRKSNLCIKLVDAEGSPVAGVPVRVELKRHSFPFGAVATPGFFQGPNAEALKQYYLKYFNSAGFGMGLKTTQCRAGTCEHGWDNRFYKIAEKEMAWFKKHGIKVRGHNLAWEGKDFLHKAQQTILNDPNLEDREKGQRVFGLMSNHFHHAIPKWDVYCWDVINEPRVNHVVNDLLPNKNTFVEWFRLAGVLRAKYGRPDLQLYYNENNVLSWTKYRSYEENRDNYMGHIQDVIDAGVPIDGIGFQYRFKSYVSPEVVYTRLRDFERFNLPCQATEFELMGDKQMATEQGVSSFSSAEKKKMTAELMTIFFSHRLAAGFWHWTFIDRPAGAGKKYPYALFSHDGRPNPEMEQWIKMMEEDFNTDETLETDQYGAVTVRGFKGIYRVSYRKGDITKAAAVTLEDDTTSAFRY